MTWYSIQKIRPWLSCAPDRSLRQKCAAFSLIEIAMGLGIASFVLVSLIGLMSVGLTAGKESREETTVSMLASSVLADLREKAVADQENASRYFDFDGVETTSASGGAYFECQIEFTTPTLERPGLGERAKNVIMRFSWPYIPGAASASKSHLTFTTCLAEC